jgi:hypothetical protein
MPKHSTYSRKPRFFPSTLHVTRVALLASVLWSAPAIAQGIPQVEPPPLVRFTGTLYPLEEKKGDLHVLTVSIKGTKWLFRITKVEKLTGRAASELRILEGLFPPQLQLLGPEELLGPLQAPEITGKPLALEGRLYTGGRMLFLTAVEEVAGKGARDN